MPSFPSLRIEAATAKRTDRASCTAMISSCTFTQAEYAQAVGTGRPKHAAGCGTYLKKKPRKNEANQCSDPNTVGFTRPVQSVALTCPSATNTVVGVNYFPICAGCQRRASSASGCRRMQTLPSSRPQTTCAKLQSPSAAATNVASIQLIQ